MTYRSREKTQTTYVPRKGCRFCIDKDLKIDYKDVKGLQKFISSYGRIESRKRTGNCVKHQRKVALAVKRARILALLPYVNR